MLGVKKKKARISYNSVSFFDMMSQILEKKRKWSESWTHSDMYISLNIIFSSIPTEINFLMVWMFLPTQCHFCFSLGTLIWPYVLRFWMWPLGGHIVFHKLNWLINTSEYPGILFFLMPQTGFILRERSKMHIQKNQVWFSFTAQVSEFNLKYCNSK